MRPHHCCNPTGRLGQASVKLEIFIGAHLSDGIATRSIVVLRDSGSKVKRQFAQRHSKTFGLTGLVGMLQSSCGFLLLRRPSMRPQVCMCNRAGQ